MWRRQLRWARVRRFGVGGYFAAEILTGPFLPLLGALLLMTQGALTVLLFTALCLSWYLAEAALAVAAGWPASPRCVLAWVLRDAMLPVLWVVAMTGSGFEWRGNRMAPGALPVPTRSGSV